MDRKDHLTEILTLRERADEDRYFAERDRELIARLKLEQESEQEATIRALARSRCPQCGIRLQPFPFHGSTIAACRLCHGAWLSKEKLEAVNSTPGEEEVRKFFRLLVDLMEPPHENTPVRSSE